MKVAEARYTGRMGSANRRAPSGDSYHFPSYADPDLEDREWRPIEDIDDARWFDETQDQIEVRWNPLGQLRAAAGDAVEAMKEWGYSTKRKVASELDLGLEGNPSEDELEAELTGYIHEKQENGEL